MLNKSYIAQFTYYVQQSILFTINSINVLKAGEVIMICLRTVKYLFP